MLASIVWPDAKVTVISAKTSWLDTPGVLKRLTHRDCWVNLSPVSARLVAPACRNGNDWMTSDFLIGRVKTPPGYYVGTNHPLGIILYDPLVIYDENHPLGNCFTEHHPLGNRFT